jgi:O-antigen ligase
MTRGERMGDKHMGQSQREQPRRYWPSWRRDTPGERREQVAGALMIIGLCWAFILPSISPIRWWMCLPVAMLGALLRWRGTTASMRQGWPVVALFVTVLLYAGYGLAVDPLSDYGVEKVIRLLTLGGMALVVLWRQAPLTPALMRGMRLALAGTCLLAVGVALLRRDLFVDVDAVGMEGLRRAFSLTGFPLVLAISAVWMLPTRPTPWAALIGSAALVGMACLEVLIRGRFHAMTLCALAVLVLVGPPWRFWAGRLAAGLVVAALAVGLYLSVVPRMGGSYDYLRGLTVGRVGGRPLIFREAWEGFVTHPWGQGIGGFARQEPTYGYPHNIVLEAAYELGIAGLVCLVAIYLSVGWRACQLWGVLTYRPLGALLFLVFLHMTKAGDLGTMAFHWVFLYRLLVMTPWAGEGGHGARATPPGRQARPIPAARTGILAGGPALRERGRQHGTGTGVCE